MGSHTATASILDDATSAQVRRWWRQDRQRGGSWAPSVPATPTRSWPLGPHHRSRQRGAPREV